MATHFDEAKQIVISEDAARGGVTGHNVRYVLVFGMTGIIAMFAIVAAYLGYDSLRERLAASLATSPWEAIQAFAPYAAIVLVGAIGAGLLLGVWSLIAGRAEDGSQSFMRARRRSVRRRLRDNGAPGNIGLARRSGAWCRLNRLTIVIPELGRR